MSAPILTADYAVGAFFDEMFEAPGVPREHYRALFDQLTRLDGPSFS